MNEIKLAVYSTATAREPQAKQLAHELSLPYQDHAEFLLLYTPEHTCLVHTTHKSNPIFIDFNKKTLNYRRKNLSIRRELLARALGLKGNTAPTIVDATAGLAQDSFILAALGCTVQMLERSPIIAALIEDGLARAKQIPKLTPIINRMHLLNIDATTWLTHISTPPEIIYLDPMFPEKKKTALSKKEMRIFHEIVGDDLDADTLLKTALSCATERVVVKRPRLAKELASLNPSYSLTGNSSRFDVYLITRK